MRWYGKVTKDVILNLSTAGCVNFVVNRKKKMILKMFFPASNHFHNPV